MMASTALHSRKVTDVSDRCLQSKSDARRLRVGRVLLSSDMNLPHTAPPAFFSYAREDADFALRLAEDLKAAGALVWLDQLDIQPGQRWDQAVEEALTQCVRMLVVLTPAAVSSTNVMDEVSFALEERKTIIPIIHRDCVIP
jgi:TIR domain